MLDIHSYVGNLGSDCIFVWSTAGILTPGCPTQKISQVLSCSVCWGKGLMTLLLWLDYLSWIKDNIHISKMVIRSFDKGNFRFLVAASVNVYLWIWVEGCQQERINEPHHYLSPRPQYQGALVGSCALSYTSDLMFVLPTGQYSLGMRVGKGAIGSSLKFIL